MLPPMVKQSLLHPDLSAPVVRSLLTLDIDFQIYRKNYTAQSFCSTFSQVLEMRGNSDIAITNILERAISRWEG